MSKIAVWGDSITWGAFDLEKGGWVNRLKLYFDEKYQGEPEVYNLGISGDRVGDVLRRFTAEYNARKPETVILAIGINDTPHGSGAGTAPEEFDRDLTDLVGQAKIARRVVIVGLTKVDETHSGQHGYKNSFIKQYDQMVKRAADLAKVTYVEVYSKLVEGDLTLDGLHPDASGHAKIFVSIKEALGY